MTIETSLHEEILNGFDDLNRMERGTETHKTTVDELAKLLDRAIEIEKLEMEAKEREKAREIEASLKRAQMEEDRKDRRVKNGIALSYFPFSTSKRPNTLLTRKCSSTLPYLR